MGAGERGRKYIVGLRGGTYLVLEVDEEFAIGDPPTRFNVWSWASLGINQTGKPHFEFSPAWLTEAIELPEVWSSERFDSFTRPRFDIADYESAKVGVKKRYAELLTKLKEKQAEADAKAEAEKSPIVIANGSLPKNPEFRKR